MRGMVGRIGIVAVATLFAVGMTRTVPVAMAEPPADPASIWTLQDENASISTNSLTDKYYVNGLRLGWTSPTDALPAMLANFGKALWGEGRQRLSLDITQSIYTPANTVAVPPDPTDRPYAGVLTAAASLLHDTDDARSILGIQAGMVGPAALASETQNGFHDVIGFGHTEGWASQIHNEPVAEFLGEQIWRAPLGKFGPLEFDALPQIEGGVGNLRIYGLVGSVFRIGQNLTSDFGVARPNPGLNGADAYTPIRQLAWYFFAGVDGQVVGHDITIDGNDFEHSASATRQPFLGEAEAGLTVILEHVRLSYTQIIQSQQTVGQHGGLHQFGSLTLSVRF
jgi:lipid A 3-O-deacylase